MNVLDPAGPQADNIAWLTWVFMALCLGVYLATLGALAWSVLRRPRPEDDSRAATRRLGGIVAAATAITAAVLVLLTISSEVAGRGLSKPSGPGAVTVDVIGYQWYWDFRYQDVTPSEWVSSPNELLVPVLLAATTASKALLGSDLMHESGAWIRLLIAYDLVFLIATFMAFEHVIEG